MLLVMALYKFRTTTTMTSIVRCGTLSHKTSHRDYPLRRRSTIVGWRVRTRAARPPNPQPPRPCPVNTLQPHRRPRQRPQVAPATTTRLSAQDTGVSRFGGCR
uniref:PKD_channel domain-containing protein n=1 Tax=Mesocestoides corti TaxID=53468 RepID=A0A5K3EJE2_MESCO